MPDDATGDLTLLLSAANAGSGEAWSDFWRRVHGELRRLAQSLIRTEGNNSPTLQATELVHEAWLKLGGNETREPHWENRRHFFGAAANSMRQIMVDRARRRGAQKRGGAWIEIPFGDVLDLAGEERGDAVLALDEALAELEQTDPLAAEVVKLRFFTGLSVDEIAGLHEKSTRTVIRDWKFAQAWLFKRLHQDAPSQPAPAK